MPGPKREERSQLNKRKGRRRLHSLFRMILWWCKGMKTNDQGSRCHEGNRRVMSPCAPLTSSSSFIPLCLKFCLAIKHGYCAIKGSKNNIALLWTFKPSWITWLLGLEMRPTAQRQRQTTGTQSLQHTEVLDQGHQGNISKTLTIYFHAPCAEKQFCIYSDPHS